tara:strand:- start:170 stop:487 length:318 start_codon:yes stop_codon:yes gene_type:complete
MADLNTQIALYGAKIVEDYANFSSAHTGDRGFAVEFAEGRNYVKVINTDNGSHRGVHSFIVKKATKGFVVGDILKAATWSAPATNFKRGNVFDLDSVEVRWTGAI